MDTSCRKCFYPIGDGRAGWYHHVDPPEQHEPEPIILVGLAKVLFDHRHNYDEDCIEDWGCQCGEQFIPTGSYQLEAAYMLHAEHLAKVLEELNNAQGQG